VGKQTLKDGVVATRITSDEVAFFRQSPPRSICPRLLVVLSGAHLRRFPPDVWLALFVGGGAALILLLLQAHWLIWLLPLVVAGARVGVVVWNMGRKVYQDIRLLRHGRLVPACVLRARASLDVQGRKNGILLDCLILAAEQRVSLGSTWLPRDSSLGNAKSAGQVQQAVCLTKSPGTWYLLEPLDPIERGAVLHSGSTNRSGVQLEPDHL
jgi:hypothetical protein